MSILMDGPILNQLILLGINISLLFIIVYLTLRLNKKTLVAKEKKPKKHSHLIEEAYRAINYALKHNQKKLEIVVDDIPLEEFVPFYRGLEYNGLKFQLLSRQVTNGNKNYSEYLLFDFSQYFGPRHANLEVKMITNDFDKNYLAQENKLNRNSFNHLKTPVLPSNVVPLFYKPKAKKTYENNVISVDFKTRKKVL